MSESTLTKYCPLCQQDNDCGVKGSEPCWCTVTRIAPELLEQIPEQLRRKACVCKTCADKFNQVEVKEIK